MVATFKALPVVCFALVALSRGHPESTLRSHFGLQRRENLLKFVSDTRASLDWAISEYAKLLSGIIRYDSEAQNLDDLGASYSVKPLSLEEAIGVVRKVSQIGWSVNRRGAILLAIAQMESGEDWTADEAREALWDLKAPYDSLLVDPNRVRALKSAREILARHLENSQAGIDRQAKTEGHAKTVQDVFSDFPSLVEQAHAAANRMLESALVRGSELSAESKAQFFNIRDKSQELVNELQSLGKPLSLDNDSVKDPAGELVELKHQGARMLGYPSYGVMEARDYSLVLSDPFSTLSMVMGRTDQCENGEKKANAKWKLDYNWRLDPQIRFLRHAWAATEQRLSEGLGSLKDNVVDRRRVSIPDTLAAAKAIIRAFLGVDLYYKSEFDFASPEPGVWAFPISVSKDGALGEIVYVRLLLGEEARVSTEVVSSKVPSESGTTIAAMRVSGVIQEGKVGKKSDSKSEAESESAEADPESAEVGPETVEPDTAKAASPHKASTSFSAHELFLNSAGFEKFVGELANVAGAFMRGSEFHVMVDANLPLDFKEVPTYVFQLVARDWLDARAGLALSATPTKAATFQLYYLATGLIEEAAVFGLSRALDGFSASALLGIVDESKSRLYSAYDQSAFLETNILMPDASDGYGYQFAKLLASMVYSSGNYRKLAFLTFDAYELQSSHEHIDEEKVSDDEEKVSVLEIASRWQRFFSLGALRPTVRTVFELVPDLTRRLEAVDKIEDALDYGHLIEELVKEDDRDVARL